MYFVQILCKLFCCSLLALRKDVDGIECILVSAINFPHNPIDMPIIPVIERVRMDMLFDEISST